MERHNKTVIYEGDRYDLRHLFPKNWTLQLPCRTHVPAFVLFSSHCYTDEVAPVGREALMIPDYNGNQRYFCERRYRLSLYLERWFLGWEYETCYHSADKKRGAVRWLIVEADGGIPVKVAFTVQPNRKDPQGVMIHVKTVHAYDWSQPPQMPHPHLPFDVLIKGVGVNRKAPQPRQRSGR